jgi:hypothetical protein
MAISSFSTISGVQSRDHSLHVGDIFTDDPTVRDISADITHGWIICKNISNSCVVFMHMKSEFESAL